jgi:hypothetical protein
LSDTRQEHLQLEQRLQKELHAQGEQIRQAVDHSVAQALDQSSQLAQEQVRPPPAIWEFKDVHTVPELPCDHDLPNILKRDKCKEMEIKNRKKENKR